jgi:hypothetical protein
MSTRRAQQIGGLVERFKRAIHARKKDYHVGAGWFGFGQTPCWWPGALFHGCGSAGTARAMTGLAELAQQRQPQV